MATRQTLEMRFGRTNIFQWADADNTKDESEVANRIAYALEWAQIDLLSMLNSVPPIEAERVVDDVIERKAAIWLYDIRGAGTEDTMAKHREYVDRWVNRYNTGRIKFTTPTAPHVINDDSTDNTNTGYCSY